MALTDVRIRQTAPTDKPQRLYDAGGLYLEVSKTGAKLWRWKYRVGGREKRLALGRYPDVSLRQARSDRDDARDQLADGIDPAEARQANAAAEKAATVETFEAVAREWHEKKSATWAPGHAKRLMQRLDGDVFPRIGARPVAAITAPELLTLLRGIEARGSVETAHRVRRTCSQVFRHAIASGIATNDPAAALADALQSFTNSEFAAVLDPVRLGAVLRMMAGYTGHPSVRLALKLGPMLLARPGELRAMRWSDVDLARAEWRLTLSKAKNGKKPRELVKPLPTQVVALLAEHRPADGAGYVMRSPRSAERPMSENTMRAALLALGLDGKEVTMHGFRATARTLLDEEHGIRPDIIEHELGHVVKDANGRSYNRTSFVQQRRDMLQRWADYLDELREGATVMSLDRRRVG